MHRVVAALLLAVTGCFLFPPPGDTDSDGDGGPAEALFVAVGDGGTIVRSESGAQWSISTSGVTVALNDVTHGDDLFVAVGQAGKILYSADGVEWTAGSSPSTRDLYSILYHGNRFIAVGGDYSVGAETLESADGVTWTRPDLPAPKHLLHDMASDGTTLVAIGSYQADTMSFGAFTWQDGVGWIQRIDGTALGIRYSAVGHGSPTFALLGATNSATSSDGVLWMNNALFGVVADPEALAFGPGGWIAVGGAGQILGSADARTWLARLSPFTMDLRDVASDGQRFVTVGAAGQIAYSADGLTWTAVTAPVSAELRGVTHTRQ